MSVNIFQPKNVPLPSVNIKNGAAFHKLAKWAERTKLNKAVVRRLTNSTQAVGITSVGIYLTPDTHFSIA